MHERREVPHRHDLVRDDTGGEGADAPAGRVLRALDVLARTGTPSVHIWHPMHGETTWLPAPKDAPPLALFLNFRGELPAQTHSPVAGRREGLGGFSVPPKWLPSWFFSLSDEVRAGRRMWIDRPPETAVVEPGPLPRLPSLPWLARLQREDGSIGNAGTTGLALLAFLACGETHKHGKYKKVVREGLRFLKGVQDPEGRFSADALEHALATCALAEAYRATTSPLFEE